MSQVDPASVSVEALIAQLLVQSDCDSDLRTCVENWATDVASWCNGCLNREAAAALRSSRLVLEEQRKSYWRNECDVLKAELAALRSSLASPPHGNAESSQRYSRTGGIAAPEASPPPPANAERARLHQLLCDAYGAIDPEAWPDVSAAIFAELGDCQHHGCTVTEAPPVGDGPAWWRRCRSQGHDVSVDELSHRGGRYVGAVEFFCNDCSRGQSSPLPPALAEAQSARSTPTIEQPAKHQEPAAEPDALRLQPPPAKATAELIDGYDVAFWHESYTMLREAITDHLDDCIYDTDVAEEAILIAAIKTAGERLKASSPVRSSQPSGARKLHIAFNVATNRVGGRGVACDGPECVVCASLLQGEGTAK